MSSGQDEWGSLGPPWWHVTSPEGQGQGLSLGWVRVEPHRVAQQPRELRGLDGVGADEAPGADEGEQVARRGDEQALAQGEGDEARSDELEQRAAEEGAGTQAGLRPVVVDHVNALEEGDDAPVARGQQAVAYLLGYGHHEQEQAGKRDA